MSVVENVALKWLRQLASQMRVDALETNAVLCSNAALTFCNQLALERSIGPIGLYSIGSRCTVSYRYFTRSCKVNRLGLWRREVVVRCASGHKHPPAVRRQYRIFSFLKDWLEIAKYRVLPDCEYSFEARVDKMALRGKIGHEIFRSMDTNEN